MGGGHGYGSQAWVLSEALDPSITEVSSQQERLIAKFSRNTTEAEKQNEAATEKTIAKGKRSKNLSLK